jgi:hypothetical protein
MKALNSLLAVALILLSFVGADWQYRSRPDLSPPRLNVTVRAYESVEKGYIFVAPYARHDGPPKVQFNQVLTSSATMAILFGLAWVISLAG